MSLKKQAGKKAVAKKVPKAKTTKSLVKKESDEKNLSDEVDLFMKKMKHPLKKEIEQVRKIILNTGAKIKERVKWNAPSFYYKTDMVTFNPRDEKHVHLVFHHADIMKIKSPLFSGNFSNRKMIYLKNMDEVKKAQSGIEAVMRELIKLDEK